MLHGKSHAHGQAIAAHRMTVEGALDLAAGHVLDLVPGEIPTSDATSNSRASSTSSLDGLTSSLG